MKRLSFLIVFASLMLFSFGLASAVTEITLDNMTGLLSETGDSVIMDESVRWNFRLNYTPGDGTAITGSTNGFEVYTHLGGAYTDNYTAITYDTFSLGWEDMFDLVFKIATYSIDGVGADTVGFGGAKLFGPGIADGTDTLCWWIETTPSTDSDTLCIDSAFYPPGGEWIWATNGPLGTFTPDWGGPYCFHVHDTSQVPAFLEIAPDTLYFTAVEGGANPEADTFNVSETGGGAIVFTLAESSGWFALDKAGGTTPEDVEVSVDISSLTADTYFDSVTVSSGEADNSPQFAYISLEVTPAPKFLEVTPDTLYFTAVEGGANPEADTFTVSETGGGAIAFTLAETSGWFALDKAGGTTPEDVEVSVDISGLTADTYFDSVTVSSGEADNSPQYAFISLEVTEAPKFLEVTPDTLYFTAVEGTSNPDSQSFIVSETGGAAIAFTLAETSGWFDLDKAGGTTPEDVEVSVDISGLTADIYFDSVEVSSGEADNSPQYAYISLEVTEAPKFLDVTPDTLYFTAVEGGANPDADTFTVSETGGGAIAFNLSMSSTWFGLSRMGGTTPEDVVVSVDISGLTADTYFDSVTVSSGAADNSPIYEFIVLVLSPPENNPPVLDSIGPRVVNEDEQLLFLVTASDPDEDAVTLEIDTLYDGMTFVDSGNDTATFDWTPNFDQAGVYYVIFYASDGFLADSELVEITVNNTNRPPLVDQPSDTTIDECDTLELVFSATDPDGDSITLEIDTLYENMTFDDNGDGTADFYFAPNFDQAGAYTLTVYANDGTDIDSVTFTITVEECEPPPECVDMILSDTVFFFVDTLENGGKSGSVDEAYLDITSSGDEFCFIIYPYYDTSSSWLTLSDTTGCTPATITLTADGSGMYPGIYQNMYAVLGDSTVCDPNPQYFIVILEVVDTTTPPPPAGDTLTVATVPGVPGAQVIVPVDFVNQCYLIGILAWLEWYSDYLVLDSVSWVDTRLHEFVIKIDSIFNDSNTVFLWSVDDTAVVYPGYGNFVNLHFTVAAEAPAGFYEIDLKPIDLPEHPAFTVICDEGIEIIEPEFIPGGIVVDTSGNFVCGYVVDPDGIPIPGATVELWADFPYGPPEEMTTTNGTGVFAFSDFTVVPFDLYAYHEGYYPGLVENINFSQIGIMIVLAPVEEVYPSYEWVNFYCDYNTLMDEPLPVGSVVDAYDPDGVHCGTFFVTEAGKYGFMPVYRDDPSEPGDQGADPGDIIRFFVNGTEAVTTGDRTWTENGNAQEVCLEAGIIITKTCDLVEGWNLVSWNVDHESDYILDALGSIEGYIELVLGFEQGGLTYDPDLPMFSTLWYVDHLSGYWIKTSCDVTLEITGAPVPATTPITVTTGWNLVSYLPDFTLATEDALASIHDDLIVALGYDGEALTYIPGEEPYNTLTEMSSCFGYWIKITQAGELVYPATGPVIASSQKNDNPVMSAAVPGVTATSRWVNVYAHNLTLDGETISAGATIAAYTLDGTKIGAFAMKQDGLFGFMPVYADDNATSEVEGVRAGERFYLSVNGVETNETFVWTKAGDKMEIGALTAKTNSGQALPERYSLHQNYPNPFNPTTNIGFTLPVSGKARIDIFNILGKLVATPFDGIARTGANEVVWDGRNFAGETVATGIYFYRLTADNYVETKKMTLMK